jgi:multiple sugar transport system permease protein
MRRGGRTLTYSVLLAGVIGVAFPFFWMLSTSLKTDAEADLSPPTLVPARPQWANYAEAWRSAADAASQQVTFSTYFLNSMFVAACVTAGVLFTSLLAAYAFAFMEFAGRRAIFLCFLATMMIPFEVALVPNYRTIMALGWYDTYAALIVPWCANVFSIFILRQFFRGIPRDYFEAAQIDGCGHWRFLWTVAAPMSAPALVTITLFTFLGSWNGFLWPLLVTHSPRMRVLQVGLSLLQSEESTNLNTLMAASAIVIIPVLVLYLVLQRRFIEGVAGAGLKG